MKKEQIKTLLPSVFQRTAVPGNALFAILDLMEALHGPSESVLGRLDMFFDPYRSPDEFVPYLASWVDLQILLDVPRSSSSRSQATLSTGIGRLRELTAAAVTLSHWRGTRKGLQLFLETATGMRGFEINESATGADGTPRPFHLQIKAPGQLAQHRALVTRIVELEKPAYVTYELEFETQESAKSAT
jgi:phage tail-like protein